jgi:hypothetical protein
MFFLTKGRISFKEQHEKKLKEHFYSGFDAGYKKRQDEIMGELDKYFAKKNSPLETK